jgi:predicted RNA polymerase sigma factor
VLDRVWARGEPGPYQVQAAIAALHAASGSPPEIDWPQIAGLYRRLEELTPTPPVRLSRVVAVAKAFGPGRGLALLDELNLRFGLDAEPLTRQRERAVRAHLLRLCGDPAGAAASYREAAALTGNGVERHYLLTMAADVLGEPCAGEVPSGDRPDGPARGVWPQATGSGDARGPGAPVASRRPAESAGRRRATGN